MPSPSGVFNSAGHSTVACIVSFVTVLGHIMLQLRFIWAHSWKAHRKSIWVVIHEEDTGRASGEPQALFWPGRQVALELWVTNGSRWTPPLTCGDPCPSDMLVMVLL